MPANELTTAVQDKLAGMVPEFAARVAPLFAKNDHRWLGVGVPDQAEIAVTLYGMIDHLRAGDWPVGCVETGRLMVQYIRWPSGNMECRLMYNAEYDAGYIKGDQP